MVEDPVTNDEFSQQSVEQEIPAPTESGDEHKQAKGFHNSFIEHCAQRYLQHSTANLIHEICRKEKDLPSPSSRTEVLQKVLKKLCNANIR